VGRRGRYLDLGRALSALARSGLTEILVEGGGGLGAALLRKGLVDEVNWFVAPALLGSDARAALGPLGIRRLDEAGRLRDIRQRRVGVDLHVCGRLSGPPSTAGAHRGGGRNR